MKCKGKYKVLLVIIVLSFFIGCISCTSNSEEIKVLDTIEEEIIIEENNFSIEYVKALDENAETEFEEKVETIYSIFDESEWQIKTVKFIVTNKDKINRDSNRIFVNYDSLSDEKLIELILRYEFSDTLHYGLMYGLTNVIQENLDHVETRGGLTEEDMNKYWGHMYLSYINFAEGINGTDEIDFAERASIELVNYILLEYDYDKLFTLMSESTKISTLESLNNIIKEWQVSKIGRTIHNATSEIGVYSLNSDEDCVEYHVGKMTWILSLVNADLQNDVLIDANNSVEDYYNYLAIFYNEVDRLEERLKFDIEKLPPIEIKIYTNDENKTSISSENLTGYYDDREKKIVLYSVMLFSHELVHYIDHNSDRINEEGYYKEIRAVYFSSDFELEEEVFNKKVLPNRNLLLDNINKDFKRNAWLISEDYTQHELDYKTYNTLFTDINLSELTAIGNDFPPIRKETNGNSYPKQYWISFMKYLERNYGYEAIDSLMFENKLPDSQESTIDDVISEWQAYITDFDEDNYEESLVN